MMTDCLMEILYLPVVFQSLCNFTIKPKLQIQTALFLLSQSISAIKDEKLSGLLLQLTFGDQISQHNLKVMSEKELFSSPLYASSFQHTHTRKYSELQLGCAFAQQSQENFDNYLHSTWMTRDSTACLEWVRKDTNDEISAIKTFEKNLTDE